MRPSAYGLGLAAALAAVLAACLSCRPSVDEGASTIASSMESISRGQELAAIEGLPATQASRDFLRGLVQNGVEIRPLVRAVASVLRRGRVGEAFTFMAGGDPAATVQLVPDGHAWLVDLALSGVTFQDLHDKEYPEPW